MENLTQKYIKYFYITLIIVISAQLLNAIIMMLTSGLYSDTFILMFLSIINIMVLSESIKHNIKQEFTECKVTAKILRFGMGLLILFHALLGGKHNINWIMLLDHIATMVIIELVLTFRIKSIEHLEKLANEYQFRRENGMLE